MLTSLQYSDLSRSLVALRIRRFALHVPSCVSFLRQFFQRISILFDYCFWFQRFFFGKNFNFWFGSFLGACFLDQHSQLPRTRRRSWISSWQVSATSDKAVSWYHYPNLPLTLYTSWTTPVGIIPIQATAHPLSQKWIESGGFDYFGSSDNGSPPGYYQWQPLSFAFNVMLTLERRAMRRYAFVVRLRVDGMFDTPMPNIQTWSQLFRQDVAYAFKGWVLPFSTSHITTRCQYVSITPDNLSLQSLEWPLANPPLLFRVRVPLSIVLDCYEHRACGLFSDMML